MAVTLDQYVTQPRSSHTNIQGFANNAYSADYSGTEEIVAAVAAKSIYIESISINSASAISVTIGAGETGGAVTNELWGPIVFSANGGHFASHYFPTPLKVTAATAVVADASGAGPTTIMVTGYIA